MSTRRDWRTVIYAAVGFAIVGLLLLALVLWVREERREQCERMCAVRGEDYVFLPSFRARSSLGNVPERELCECIARRSNPSAR